MTPFTSQEVHPFQRTTAELNSGHVERNPGSLSGQNQAFGPAGANATRTIRNHPYQRQQQVQPSAVLSRASRPPRRTLSEPVPSLIAPILPSQDSPRYRSLPAMEQSNTSKVQSSPLGGQGLLALSPLGDTIGALFVGGEGVATGCNNPSTLIAGQGPGFPPAAALDTSGASGLERNAMNRTIGNSALEPGQFSSESSANSSSHGLSPIFDQHFTAEPLSEIPNPTSNGHVSDNLLANQGVSPDHLVYPNPTLNSAVAPIQGIKLPSYLSGGSFHLCLCPYLPVACDSCIYHGIEARHLPLIPTDRLPRRRLSNGGNDRTPLTLSEELSIVYLRLRHNKSYGDMGSKGFSKGTINRLLNNEDIKKWLGSIQPPYTQ